MEKLSSVDVQRMLRLGAEAMLKVASERDRLVSENRSLRVKLAQFQLSNEVTKLAETIHARGLDSGRTPEETRIFLLGKAAEGKLELVKQAVELSASGRPLGHAGDVPPGAGEDLDSFVMG